MNRVHDGFIGRLESLRGIAALSVAVFHSMIWLAFGTERALFTQTITSVHGGQATIARAVLSAFCGPSAVVVFFVLSGFVLARSLRKEPLSVATYVGYCVKRMMRILPALAFSIALVLLYLAFLHPGYREISVASVWFNWWYKEPVVIMEVAKNLAMLSASLNSNAWTLRIEMLASLAMPFVVMAIGHRGIGRSLVAVAVCFAWAAYTDNPESAPSEFAHYAYMFVLGVAVEKHTDQIKGMPRALSALLVMASMVAMIAVNAFWPLFHLLYGDAVTAIGAAALILVISVDRDAAYLSILDSSFARYLGRVSYSFYILHFLFLYVAANFTLRHVPEWLLTRYPLVASLLIGGISIAVTLAIASFSYRFVERPMTMVGKRIAGIRCLSATTAS